MAATTKSELHPYLRCDVVALSKHHRQPRRRPRHDEQHLRQRRPPHLLADTARRPVAFAVHPPDSPGDRIDLHLQQPPISKSNRTDRTVRVVVPHTDPHCARDTSHRCIAKTILAPSCLQRSCSGASPVHQTSSVVPLCKRAKAQSQHA